VTGKHPAKKKQTTRAQFADAVTPLRQKNAELKIAKSEPKQAEEAPQKRERRYRQPFGDTNSGISVLSRDGRFVAINPKFAELAGLSKEESIGKTPESFFPAGNVTEAYRCKQERTAKLSKANADAKKEIAQRRLTEENIRRAKREWEATFDAVSDLILITDLNGTIRRCNRAVSQAFKTSYQNLIGRSVDEVLYGTVNPATGTFHSLLSEPGSARERIEAQFPRLTGWFEVTRHPVTSPKRKSLQATVYTLVDISERKRTEKQLQASHKQLRALSAHLQSVREEERKRVAREIHDELGQVLTSLKMDLSRIASQLPTTDHTTPPVSRGQVTSISKLIDTALLSVRRISTSLRPQVLDHFGLIAAMEWQAQEFQNRTGIRCKFVSTLESVDLDQDRCTAMFRILQETLTNVARHAEATKVNISLKENAENFLLKVSDNGKGITESEITHANSLGLLGIQERVFLLGGEFHIKGVEGKGTTVAVRIPSNRVRQN
jgi:PAS domain S-box-containing protein